MRHIGEHGIDKDDVAHVFDHPVGFGTSDASGLPIVFGFAMDDRYMAVIYEHVDKETVYPIPAFEVPEPSSE